jgi:hypothetical protein
MSSKKQTALEWLESRLNSVKPTDFCSIEKVKDWINQAKEMEKEQIMDAVNYGCSDFGSAKNGEQYYSETYGQ